MNAMGWIRRISWTSTVVCVLGIGAAGTVAGADFELWADGKSPGGWFGNSIALVPDQGGDGRSEIAVGACWESAGGVKRAGMVRLFDSATSEVIGQLFSPATEVDGGFGCAVAGIQDLNNDGRGDLIVGAFREDSDGQPMDSGRVYVYTRALDTPRFILSSPNGRANGGFGTAVAAVPDLNGDGIEDILVGADGETSGTGPAGAGRAYIFDGQRGFLLWTLSSPHASLLGGFGGAVAGVADMNGDGRGDVLVGAPGESVEGKAFAGRAYLFSGATAELLAVWESSQPQANGGFGRALAAAGDVNGDGTPDVLVGAPGEGDAPAGAGRVWVFDGASYQPIYQLVSPYAEEGGAFGCSVAGVADVTGDGRSELLIGAYLETAEVAGAQAGRAYLFEGAGGRLLRKLESPEEQAGGRFGVVVVGGDDVTGDGWPEALIGAYLENDGVTGAEAAGRVYGFDLSRPPQIEGVIASWEGVGLEGIQVNVSAPIEPVVTDADGRYSFWAPLGWSGQTTPTAIGYVFFPESRQYVDVTEDLLQEAYRANLPHILPVSGRVRYDNGDPVPECQLFMSGVADSVGMTDASGAYTINAPYGWSGDLWVDKVGHDFTPTTRSLERVVFITPNQNFTAFFEDRFIEGRVVDEWGEPMEDVEIVVQDEERSVKTDETGAYRVAVPYTWSGRLYAATARYSFAPMFRSFTGVTINLTEMDFFGTPYPVVSGWVVTADGAGVEGVMVTTSDDVSTTTGADGAFVIEMEPRWSGWLEAAKDRYRITPERLDVEPLTTSVVDLVFTAQPWPVISGRLTNRAGEGIASARIETNDDPYGADVDENGHYELTVPFGWSGWLEPRNTDGGDYVFTPPYRVVAAVGAHVPDQDFGGWTEAINVARNLSDRLPPVADQTTEAMAPYGTADFSELFGVGPAWAMGYYLKTALTAETEGWEGESVRLDRSRQFSPYFLANNGGYGSPAYVGALLEGHGACRLADYDAYSSMTLEAHLEQAAADRSLSAISIFRNEPSDRRIVKARLKSWDNDTTRTRELIYNGNPFVLALPVYESFVDYTGGLYDVLDPENEELVGFHAVCVVGYDETVRAYLIVNSWGANWGMGGYGWISQRFVADYALEAWRLREPQGFEPDESTLPAPGFAGPGRVAIKTDDYTIVYDTKKSTGALTVSAEGIVIEGGDPRDRLSVWSRVKNRVGETIPLIRSDSGFRKVYLEGRVERMAVAGRVESLVARKAHVEDLEAGAFERITMTDVADSTWVDWSARLSEPHVRLPNVAMTHIRATSETASGVSKIRVRLSGVQAGTLILPEGEATISLSARKFARTGGMNPAVSAGGFTGDTFRTGELKKLKVSRASVTATHLLSTAGADHKSKIKLAGGVYTVRLYKDKAKWGFAGNLDVDRLDIQTDLLKVKARGGDVRFGVATVTGAVAELTARDRRYRDGDRMTHYLGGVLGREGEEPSLLAVGLNESKKADVKMLYGSFGIRGEFMAGATWEDGGETLRPTCRGGIRRMETKRRGSKRLPDSIVLEGGPLIEGRVWMAPGARLRLKGDKTSVSDGRLIIESCE